MKEKSNVADIGKTLNNISLKRMESEKTEINLKEVRDKLIAKKALFQQNQITLTKLTNKLKTILDSLENEQIEQLRNKGLAIDSILQVDYNKLQTDATYIKTYKTILASFIVELKNTLKDIL